MARKKLGFLIVADLGNGRTSQGVVFELTKAAAVRRVKKVFRHIKYVVPLDEAATKRLRETGRLDLDALELRGQRNVSQRARRYIGRTIRRLARKGEPAPKRIAVAYAKARRRGFRVPKRGRRNISPPYSEKLAWRRVKQLGQAMGGGLDRHSRELMMIADAMLEQLGRGVHHNPTLAIAGNPSRSAKVVKELGRVVEIRYKRKDDGGFYYHPFRSRPRLLALSDGTIAVRP